MLAEEPDSPPPPKRRPSLTRQILEYDATNPPTSSMAAVAEEAENEAGRKRRPPLTKQILEYDDEPKSKRPARPAPTTASLVLNAVSIALMVVLAYVAFLFFFNVDYLLPYDSGFALVVLWVAAKTGAQLAKLVGLPALLGMLCAGILVKNCGDLARGLPNSWGTGIRAFGLMNILMRGGLEMDFGAVKRLGFAVVRLTVLPGVSEAFASAGLACAIFDMPFFLALAMGFILGAVSPAVVVGGMFSLQSQGYGVAQGIPSLVVAAASFDDVVAISGFSMFIGLAVGKGDVLYSALHGPQEIGLGLVGGLLGGCIMTVTVLWNKPWKRAAVLLILGIGFVFSANYAHFSGAGALASLVMAGATGQFWARGFGGPLSLGPNPEFVHEAEHDLCTVWEQLAQPLLFGVIGSALDFGKVQGETVPKALAVILGGVLIRCTAAFFATLGAGLKFKDRLFIALAWMPKATVQAALGSVPLDMILNTFKREDDVAKYDKFVQHGTDIITVAVFSILVTAPAGLIIIQRLGPRWLDQVKTQQDDIENIGNGEASTDGSTPSRPQSKEVEVVVDPKLGLPGMVVSDLSEIETAHEAPEGLSRSLS